ncbi:MAG: SGNH/GDSL hydrolase family protein, partial [Patescibacteria group bacterium]|nr:SGNH/GDSL hydrolase family protein [Patescibacteria group bacterium]
MRDMHSSVFAATFLAFAVLGMPGPASAAEFNQFIAFGDSTLDTGYFRYHPSGNATFDAALPIAIQQGATGGFAGNGVMNTIILADKFGLNAAPSSNGGTNYANGGATTVVNDAPDYPNNITTIQQIQNYLTSVNNVANPNAFYLIKTGDNDATYVNNQLAIDPNWLNTHPNYLRDVAAALSVEVANLQAAGARHIMVRNSYDAALFAGLGGDIPESNQAAYARSKSLMTWEWQYLAERGVRFIPADNDSLFSFVVHNPTSFGFTAHSVLSSSAPFFMVKSAALCILTPAEQQGYLFIDGVHLTTAGQTIEADYEYSLLIAPSQVSRLAENAVMAGWARAATIQGQIEASSRHRGPCGYNLWTSVGANSMRIKNAPGFPDDSGAPIGGAVGVDFLTQNGSIMGAAFSAGGQSQAFSSGGHFDQTDQALSFYVARMGDGPLWGNAVLTYSILQDSISRPVPLGIFTDQNN